MKVLRDGVECPSLSPDGKQIAYKSRIGDASRWHLRVLDVATLEDHAVAETRSIDDQAEWLDDDTLAYSDGTNVYTVPADGSGEPGLLVRDATSPVRAGGQASPSVARPLAKPKVPSRSWSLMRSRRLPLSGEVKVGYGGAMVLGGQPAGPGGKRAQAVATLAGEAAGDGERPAAGGRHGGGVDRVDGREGDLERAAGLDRQRLAWIGFLARELNACPSGSMPTVGSSTVSSSTSAGISIWACLVKQADGEPRALPPGLEACRCDLAERAPVGRSEAVDLLDRLEQGLGAAEGVLVVAVEDQRLVEEGAQGQLGRSSGRRSGGAGGPARRRRTRRGPSRPGGRPARGGPATSGARTRPRGRAGSS